MLRKRTIQTHAARDNLMTSPSSGDPGALSGALAGGSFVGGVAGAMALADSPYPRPGSEPAEIRRYFRGNSGAARLSVVGQLISAASLARFTASVARLAARSGRGSRGLRAASKGGKRGGRGRANGDIKDVKAWLLKLASDVEEGRLQAKDGSVVSQILNVFLRGVEMERRMKESEELEERLEAVERVLKGRKVG